MSARGRPPSRRGDEGADGQGAIAAIAAGEVYQSPGGRRRGQVSGSRDSCR